MKVPIFNICNESASLKLLLGDNPMRLFEFDEAPDKVAAPYVVWQDISGSPKNYLAGRPDISEHRIQIDVYASNAIIARRVQRAVERAIELQCHIVSFNGSNREKDTRLYRISFDATWFVNRK